MTNFRIYHESASSIKSALTREGKKERKMEVQKFENFEDKRSFFGKIKNIFENFR